LHNSISRALTNGMTDQTHQAQKTLSIQAERNYRHRLGLTRRLDRIEELVAALRTDVRALLSAKPRQNVVEHQRKDR
jgi:hypothetical protein